MRHARDSAVSVAIASRVMAKKMDWAVDTPFGVEDVLSFFDDTVGWAHGAIDVMRAAGHSPYAIRFEDKRTSDPRYYNLRSEMWMKMADWIKAGGCLPNIPELVAELTSPTYAFHEGKFLLESKDQIKKRLGKSPDMTWSVRLFCTPHLWGRGSIGIYRWPLITVTRITCIAGG
jgi:hypothetical protein